MRVSMPFRIFASLLVIGSLLFDPHWVSAASPYIPIASVQEAAAGAAVDEWSMSSTVSSFFRAHAVAEDVSTTLDCPATCSDGEAWCKKIFGRGGAVTLGARCGSGAFECVCNDILTIEVSVATTTAGLECSWSETFDAYPDGAYCYEITGVGPASCSVISASLCDWTSTCTQNAQTGVVNYTCTTCEGDVFKIEGTPTDFSRTVTPATGGCNPATTCKNHGCCSPLSTCSCNYDPLEGYWTGASCDVCADGYQGSDCRTPIPTIQILLSSIARTWTMVAPNMAVMFLFVVMGLARRLWESDRTFQLTRLRRANLSPVQVARRGQQSLFRSKYIPRRPASSRSFAKDEKPAMRGPPAY